MLLHLFLAAQTTRTSEGSLSSLTKALGSTIFWVKVIVILVCAPIWYPIVKALLKEINGSLRGEGGILARSYNARDLKRLEQDEGVYQDPLRSIPRTAPGVRRADAGNKPPAAGTTPRAPGRGSAAPRRPRF
jgi:hypothetical protein